MIALRYLRARRAHGSVSVIAGFSFVGIVLGVAALIVVMAVMNGFRHDLMDKMIGLNGHMFLQGVETPLTDYEAVTERVAKVPGVTLALPLVEGQAFASSSLGAERRAGARRARGGSEAPAGRRRSICSRARSTVSTPRQGVASAPSSPSISSLRVGDKITLIAPHGAQTPFGVTPRMKSYVGRLDLPDRHGDLRRHVRVHAAGGGAGVLQHQRRRPTSSRSMSPIPTISTRCATRSRRPSSGR